LRGRSEKTIVLYEIELEQFIGTNGYLKSSLFVLELFSFERLMVDQNQLISKESELVAKSTVVMDKAFEFFRNLRFNQPSATFFDSEMSNVTKALGDAIEGNAVISFLVVVNGSQDTNQTISVLKYLNGLLSSKTFPMLCNESYWVSKYLQNLREQSLKEAGNFAMKNIPLDGDKEGRMANSI
jgi:hypothetical protein